MIFLWGLAEDAPLRMVHDALQQMGAPCLFLDHGDLLETHMETECSPAITGVLEVRGARYLLDDVRAMYVRPYDLEELPHLAGADPDGPEWRHGSLLKEMLWSFAEEVDGLVLNRPSAMHSNGSKPYQSRLIAQQGFEVPETLITNDVDVLRGFRAEYDAVVYKSISGTRSIVGLLSNAHEPRMEDLRWCPTQFQARIEGIDHRIHVVGSRVFAVRFASEAVDYRYGESAMEACEIPDDIAERCVSLAGALGLPLAGVDLIRTPDDRWFCLEVNPSPAYAPYELVTGEPMSVEIAKLLASH